MQVRTGQTDVSTTLSNKIDFAKALSSDSIEVQENIEQSIDFSVEFSISIIISCPHQLLNNIKLNDLLDHPI